jgi:ABC-type transport system substrate-binding protein
MNGNLVVALTDVRPENLDPYKSNTLHIHTVMWPIYEPLFDIGDNGQPVARLATSWDVSADGLTYDFHLRDDVTFSNATPFDANSVVENLNRVKQRPTSFRERILDKLIDHVHPLGPHTVRVKLAYPKFELLFLALMTDRSEPPLGTGPFCLESMSASEIVLKRNEHYRAQVRLHHITFRVIAHPDDLVPEFNAQRLDFIRDIDDERLRKLDRASRLEVVPFGLHYLGFNWGSPAFKTPAVRQAFRDMINFKQIESKTGLRPAKGPIPPRVEAYAGSTPSPQQQSPAEARRTLENACGNITLLYNQNSYYGDELATRIKSDLGNLINSQPQSSSSQLLQALTGRRDSNTADNYVFIYNWYSILPAAEIFLLPLFETGVRDNLTGYSEPQVDNTLGEIHAGRIAPGVGYSQIQAKIVDDQPAIFLGHSQVRHSAHSASVTGLKGNLNTQSFPVDRYVGVDVP